MSDNRALLDKVITVKEAARLAGKSASAIHWQILGGKIEARKSGGQWLVSRQSVIEYYNLYDKES